MSVLRLYKYLDAKGGLKMLKHGNLQFTNATKLNDPFDCHPALVDFSNVPKEACKAWPADDISWLMSGKFQRNRDKAWICSLSKVYDAMLIKIDEEKKAEIIKTALTLNPDIKIYQMEIDPKAFRLKEKQI